MSAGTTRSPARPPIAERLCGWRPHAYGGDCCARAVAVIERPDGQRLNFACAAHASSDAWQHLVCGPYRLVDLADWIAAGAGYRGPHRWSVIGVDRSCGRS